tara:strand:+ start:2730 stop:3962 length:1233 start_codon:yes stop_codon:yes gene_type:complete
MMISRSRDFKELPINILWCAIFLNIIGLVVLKSIAQHSTGGMLQNPFSKQILFLIPALFLCTLIYYTPRSFVHKYSYTFYCLGIILVLLPFLGEPQAGTYRWLYVGLPFNVQPSEFAKLFTIIALARYLSDHNLKMKNFTSVIIPILLGLLPTVIILQQPDLGTAIIMITPLLPMLYWSGARFFHLFLLLAPILSMLTAFHNIAFSVWAVLFAFIIFYSRPELVLSILLFFGNIFLGLLSPALWNNFFTQYQRDRILTLFNPEKDPLGAAYQIIQSKTAIGSGGLLGKGWGAGTQTHLKFLPVQESDFILSVMGEELGFIAIATVLVVFGYFSIQILKYSYLSKDRFSSLAMVGFASVFISHVFVNTAMTVGLIPVKGLPFPFISAGGSFLITSYIMLGLVLKLSINYSD